MKNWLLLAVFVTTPFLWSYTGSEDPPVPRADHHVHIRTEAATDALVRIQKRLDQAVSDGIDSKTGAEDVIALLDTTRMEKATLLSVAYFFGIPEVDFENEYARVRAENDYVARETAKYSDRLVGFCSVNPLADYALKEIERCAEDEQLTGLKLHFANSDVDLRDSEDVEQIAEVFATANLLELSIVVHLWTRHPDYGRKDVEIFIRDVLAEAPDVPVQIAHLGGPGPFRAATDSASKAFADAIENGTAAMDNVFFDMAAVTLDPNRVEGDSAQIQQIRQANQKAARRIQELGVDRVLFGSDWVARPPASYAETLQSLPLPEEMRQDLYGNTAPYLQ